MFLKELYPKLQRTINTKNSALFCQSLTYKCLNSVVLMGFHFFFLNYYFFAINLSNIPQRGCITVARPEGLNLARPCSAKDQINFLASSLAAKLSVFHYLHRKRGLRGSRRSS